MKKTEPSILINRVLTKKLSVIWLHLPRGPSRIFPFSFASMSSALASYLSSRGFTSPSPSSPFPFLLFFFPPLHSPLLPLHALCPQNLGALEDSLVQYPWSLLPSTFLCIIHCTYHPIHHSSIALPHLILDKENGLVSDLTDLAPLLKWRPTIYSSTHDLIRD